MCSHLFELLYKLHVLVDDHGPHYNPKNLGGILFDIFDEFVSFHKNTVYYFWFDLLCWWSALKIVYFEDWHVNADRWNDEFV